MSDDRQRYTGVVERWNDERGFGFVRRDNDDGPRLFVHARGVAGGGRKTLAVGQPVEFGIGHNDDGRARCENLVVLDQAAT